MPERLRAARNKCVGAKQTLKAVQSGQARVVYVAQDADARVVGPVLGGAQELGLEIVRVNTMKELGKMCGIEVGAAVAAVLTA
ncbi:MAG: ribosomal L7Ae/L30e/S12e/Gadd45 family protein [Bacillota bacterium]|nr:ribosomal L7Ae/L30e/S12e/Gadd45 family protein [Bacillota bacterium]